MTDEPTNAPGPLTAQTIHMGSMIPTRPSTAICGQELSSPLTTNWSEHVAIPRAEFEKYVNDPTYTKALKDRLCRDCISEAELSLSPETKIYINDSTLTEAPNDLKLAGNFTSPASVFSPDGILLLSGDGESGIGNVIANWIQAQVRHGVERKETELKKHYTAEIDKRLKNLKNTVESYKTRLEATQLSLGKAYHQSLQTEADTWNKAADTLQAVYGGNEWADEAIDAFRAKAQDRAPKPPPDASHTPDSHEPGPECTEECQPGLAGEADEPKTKKRAGVPLFGRRRTREDFTLSPGEPKNEEIDYGPGNPCGICGEPKANHGVEGRCLKPAFRGRRYESMTKSADENPLFDIPGQPDRFSVVEGQVDWQYYTHAGTHDQRRPWVNTRGDWYSWAGVYEQCRKRPDGDPVILSHPLTLAAPTTSTIEDWGKLKRQVTELVEFFKKMGLI